MLLVLSLVACDDTSSSQASPTPTPSCQPKYVYDGVQDKGTAMVVVDREANYNGSTGVADMTLTAMQSGTVSISRSKTQTETTHVQADGAAIVGGTTGNIEAVGILQAQAIYEKVSQINTSVSTTETVSFGNQWHITVPAMSWGYGVFGIYVQITTGHLYSQNCPQNVDFGNVTTLTPYNKGWCTWTRGPSTFTGGGQGPCLVVE